MNSNATSLVANVGFEIISSGLSQDVESAIRSALADNAVFENEHDALAIFRQALAASIRDIETHPRGALLQDLLRKGPYENVGEIPSNLVGERLSDAECAAAITFIYSHMVNCFKGALAELLAAKACSRLLKRLQQDGKLPENARLYVGDSVRIRGRRGKGLAKGADLHILREKRTTGMQPSVMVAGVVEVKSYVLSETRLRKQLDQHLQRAQGGLWVCGVDFPSENISVVNLKGQRAVRIAVVPGDWKLPRPFRFQGSKDGRLLRVDAGDLPRKENEITPIANDEWRITLKWSEEALAEAAYEMTFWYMGKIGELIYAKSRPKSWEEMTPYEAGQNAAKMMLYYAILRCRTNRDEQRAVALYNSYGYGYALGMNYRNSEGKREMLWPEDLDEILSTGSTKSGCRIT